MAYRLLPDESVPESIRRIHGEQIDNAIDEIDDGDLGPHDTVHQVRKRCKKIRGLVRLVRPCFEETYSEENAWFRDTARLLSDLRDAHVRTETVELLADAFSDGVDPEAFEPVRTELLECRDRLMEEQDPDDRLGEAQDRLETARQRPADWPLETTGFDAVAGGLRKTYRRARRRFRKAYDDPTTERFHEWRKRVKYHRYHCRLLEEIWDPLLDVRREAAHDLSDLLGDDHDLAVLRRTLSDRPDAYGGREGVRVLVGVLDRQRAEYQARARPLGAKLFAETPDDLVSRFGAYFDAWRREPAEPRPVGRVIVPADA